MIEVGRGQSAMGFVVQNYFYTKDLTDINLPDLVCALQLILPEVKKKKI